MCLLINQPATAPALTTAWLADFFDYNADGVGVMYSENDCLVIEKILPKTSADFVAFYQKHIQGKQCAFHLRMRTHGATDLDNCHPYQVLNHADHGIDLALMHNGILSTGNSADTSKSDTWHYIKNYLVPMLEKNPDFFLSPAFAEIVAGHIGSGNKFILMDNLGRTVTVNKSAGVYWGGLWLSNTYAWSAPATTSKTAPAGRRVSKLAKKAKAQVDTPPEIKQAYQPSYYSYGNASNWKATGATVINKAYDDRAWQNQRAYDDYATDTAIWSNYDDTISEYFLAFEDLDLADAAKVSLNSCLDFCEIYGLEAFSEICEMVMDFDISQDWFINLMTNPNKARQAFSWLKPLKQTEGA